jgi:hypothetical protein
MKGRKISSLVVPPSFSQHLQPPGGLRRAGPCLGRNRPLRCHLLRGQPEDAGDGNPLSPGGGARRHRPDGAVVGDATRGRRNHQRALLSIGVQRLLSSLLFGVGPGDPIAPIAAVIAMTITAGLAFYLPARRAGRLPHNQALRDDVL